MGVARKFKKINKMKNRITLKNLSEISGLSISTISKSLSDSLEISNSTKKKVKKLAKKYNYRPNVFASGLRKGDVKTLGVIIPNLLNPFYAKVLMGIESTLAPLGYKIIISISHESTLKESNHMDLVTNGHVNGLIVCLAKETLMNKKFDHFNNIIKSGLPIVLFDRINKTLPCDKVFIDDFSVSNKATEFLIKKRKCKNIALVSLINDFSHGKLRVEGCKSAFRENKIKFIKKNLIESNNETHFNKKIRQLLQEEDIDGVFGITEKAMLNTIHIAKSLGYDVSNELSVVAFCNESQMEYNPSLVTIDQHAEEIGKISAKMLIKRINDLKNTSSNNNKFKTAIIKSSLIEKKNCLAYQ